MEFLDFLRMNLLTPVVLAFVLGALATLLRSDLRMPEALHTGLSIYLLLAIGLRGGGELAHTPLALLWKPALVTIGLGILTAILAFGVLRRLGRFSVPDAAALAAHYGSVSVVTFTAAASFLEALRVPVESFVPTLVVLLEIPGIAVALLLARLAGGRTDGWGRALHEIVTGRSVLLLAGGLVIGAVAGPSGLAPVSGLFVAPFQGLVMLFLLEMGMVAARRLSTLREAGLFLVAFAVLMPVVHATIAIAAATAVGMSLGGSTMLGVLAASASYIAAPSAVRLALPEANPSYYLTATLGITFPFNLAFGIPLYHAIAQRLHGG